MPISIDQKFPVLQLPADLRAGASLPQFNLAKFSKTFYRARYHSGCLRARDDAGLKGEESPRVPGIFLQSALSRFAERLMTPVDRKPARAEIKPNIQGTLITYLRACCT